MGRIHRNEETNTVGCLLSTWISLAICFVAAEVSSLDSYLRILIEGRAFWAYIASYLLVFGLSLSGLILAVPQVQRLAIRKFLVLGAAVGIPVGMAAIAINPLLLGKGWNPSLNALRDPGQLLIVAVLGMGWLYGFGVAWVSRAIIERSYRKLGYLFLGCLSIGLLERALNFFARS
jgi:hypothetical protein